MLVNHKFFHCDEGDAPNFGNTEPSKNPPWLGWEGPARAALYRYGGNTIRHRKRLRQTIAILLSQIPTCQELFSELAGIRHSPKSILPRSKAFPLRILAAQSIRDNSDAAGQLVVPVERARVTAATRCSLGRLGWRGNARSTFATKVHHLAMTARPSWMAPHDSDPMIPFAVSSQRFKSFPAGQGHPPPKKGIRSVWWFPVSRYF